LLEHFLKEIFHTKVFFPFLSQIAMVMDKFESQFEDMDAQAGCMESAISQTTASSMPQDQVDLLMQKVADEAGLEIKHGLGEVPKSSVGVAEQEPAANQEAPEDALAQRLKALRPAT
jgi:charged multivesicular body protein 1